MSNLFESREWLGEFFVPDQYDNRFFGKVCYSIDKGVILDYTVITPPQKRTLLLQDIDVLYGYLEDGRKCTLIGKFRDNLRMPLDGGHSIVRGRNPFPLLILNDFVNPDDLYSEVNFTLTGMQEFFSSEERRNSSRLSEPLFHKDTSYGALKICSAARISSLFGIDSVIHSNNKMALEELIAAYHKIKESHPSSCFEHKKEVYHYVAIKLNGSLSISGIYKQVMEIASLFALLICCPVYPKNISIYISHKDDHLEILELCPTIIADKRTMDLASTVKHHSLLPITHSYIDLGRVLEDWHKKSYQEYSVLVSAIQHETGFRTMHSLHGEIVIYLSQLESISKKEGKNREQDKYDYSIEKYASPEMREGMGKLLQKVNTNKSLGAIISNLRTDIAHVNISPKRVLTKMSLQDLADLVRYLQLTVISYVLLELGVDDVRVKAYQDKFIPKHNRG